MGYFPFFMDLTQKRCIVIGNGKVAERKAKNLRLFDGKVEIYGKDQWDMSVLSDAFVVVAATNDRNTNRKIAKFCRQRGILVNVADSKEDSTFLFPSLIKKGMVSIGISTQGNSPLLSSEIRKNIEKILPEDVDKVAEYMGEIRDDIKKLPVDVNQRKRIFQAVYEEAKKMHGRIEKEEAAQMILRLFSEQK